MRENVTNCHITVDYRFSHLLSIDIHLLMYYITLLSILPTGNYTKTLIKYLSFKNRILD